MELFSNTNRKKEGLWEEISEIVSSSSDIHISGRRCEDKWKNLTFAYRKAVDLNHKSGQGRNTCPFFQELSRIYGFRPNVEPLALSSSMNNELPELINPGEGTSQATNPTEDAEDDQPPQTKRKRTNLSNSLSEAFTTITDQLQKAEDERTKMMQEMHNEKMTLFREYLDIMKKK